VKGLWEASLSTRTQLSVIYHVKGLWEASLSTRTQLSDYNQEYRSARRPRTRRSVLSRLTTPLL